MFLRSAIAVLAVFPLALAASEAQARTSSTEKVDRVLVLKHQHILQLFARRTCS